jgi:hypothetical protein
MGGYSQQVKGVSLNWVMDQDQLNPYVAIEEYVVRVPHNPSRSSVTSRGLS